MDNVLVNGLVAVAENFRNLLVNVTGRFGDVLGGLETASQNSTQVLTHSRQDLGMKKGSVYVDNVHTPLIFSFSAGGDLLSHTLPGAVPSAQVGLASGFGKGPGVTPPLTTTDKPIQNKTHTQPNQHRFSWCVVPFQTLHNRREHTTLRQSEIVSATTTQQKWLFVLNIG